MNLDPSNESHRRFRWWLLAYFAALPHHGADFFSHQSHGKNADDRAAAAAAACHELFELWTQEVIPGKGGRPRTIGASRLLYDQDVLAAAMERSFRLWLDRELSWDKDSRRWVHVGEEAYVLSLDRTFGEDGEANPDDEARPSSPHEITQDHAAGDPALLTRFRYPFAAEVFRRAQAQLSHVDGYVPQGWPLGDPPLNGRPSPPPSQAIRNELRREILRGGLHKRYETMFGEQWHNANPALTWRALREIRREVAWLGNGENRGGHLREGRRKWGSAWLREWRRGLPWLHVPVRESDGSLRWFDVSRAWLDPTRPLWLPSDGWPDHELTGTLSFDPLTDRPASNEGWPRLVWEERKAKGLQPGANCATCHGFVSSPEVLRHHDCIQHLIQHLAQRKGLTLSNAALEVIRTAVRAEARAANEPVLERLEELISLTIGRFGHPAEEAERILEDEAA